MSDSARARLSGQLQSGMPADVRIRFYLERTPEEQQRQQQRRRQGQQEQEQGQGQRGAKGTEGDSTAVAPAALHFVGEPLLAHTDILTLGSTYLAVKLQHKCWQDPACCTAGADQEARAGAAGAASSGERAGSGRGIATLPEVLVPLSSEAEEPFARQAIEYIYTGSLSADLDFEALLRLRQQACYLGVEQCTHACDSAMVGWLATTDEEEAQQQQPQQQQQQQQDGTEVPKTSAVPRVLREEQQPQDLGGASNSTGGTMAGHQQQQDAADIPASAPRVLHAYACHALFPQPGTSPDAASFQAVRSALAQHLVSHFGDAVAALSRPDLYRQLLQLPALAVRELLAADDFGTDSEDSVFLLLACWLEAHTCEEGKEEGVPTATRAELCGLVRLHRLRPFYLNFVLPGYKPFSMINPVELGCLLRYAGAWEYERTALLEMDSKRRTSPWYCSPARRQVVPQAGRTVEWSISKEKLEEGLREMVEDKEMVELHACFGASAAAVSGRRFGSAGTGLLGDGGLWGVHLELSPAAPTAAGIYMELKAPRQLGKVQGVVTVPGVQIAVYSWALGQRKTGFSGTASAGKVVRTSGALGWSKVLKVPPAAANATGGKGNGAGGVEAEVAALLACWSRSEWMHDGKITGSITFPRP